jgi:hypothetical protein
VSRAIANIQKMEIELRKELKSITGVELLGQPEPDTRGGGGLRGSKQGLLEGPARRAKKSGTHFCWPLHVSWTRVRVHVKCACACTDRDVVRVCPKTTSARSGSS